MAPLAHLATFIQKNTDHIGKAHVFKPTAHPIVLNPHPHTTQSYQDYQTHPQTCAPTGTTTAATTSATMSLM
jgi:hypothetical protein